METSLHRELKRIYARRRGRLEVPLAGYRIDVVSGGTLIEIQHGSLASIRSKLQRLLERHRVLVVKPIVASKTLVYLAAPGGPILRRRRSPKRGDLFEIFDELIYLARLFPHPSLSLEWVLVEAEEWRLAARRPRGRHRRQAYRVHDQKLVRIVQTHRIRGPADLMRFVPPDLPRPFHTGHLAERWQIDRWVAQRIAYCLRHAGTIRQVGRLGNAHLYERIDAAAA